MLTSAVQPLDVFSLSALDTVASVTKSAVVSMAFTDGVITVEDAWEAARVDENFQIKEYGKVCVHDTPCLACSCSGAAAFAGGGNVRSWN